jgi:hypothetical protein
MSLPINRIIMYSQYILISRSVFLTQCYFPALAIAQVLFSKIRLSLGTISCLFHHLIFPRRICFQDVIFLAHQGYKIEHRFTVYARTDLQGFIGQMIPRICLPIVPALPKFKPLLTEAWVSLTVTALPA